MLNIQTIAGFAAMLLATSPIGAQTTTAETRYKAHVEFLASDLLEGREAGTRGYDIAASYVAAQFAQLGLKPANGSSWYQPVPFLRLTLDNAASRFAIDGRPFDNRKLVMFGGGDRAGRESYDAPVVFAGFGIASKALKMDDYAGLNVKGKIVAVLTGFPKGMPSDVGAHLAQKKAREAQARGAIGILSIRTIERDGVYPWSRAIEGPYHPDIAWMMPDGSAYRDAPRIGFGISLGDEAARFLFEGAPRDWAQIRAEADKKGGRPKGFALKRRASLERTTTAERFTSPNVAAVLPGSDPALANEHVLLMAHLDHIGTDPARDGDKIFNGAMDNATGVAALLEAARELAGSGQRPKRSILFAAVTAEEKGLLGSDYLAGHSALPSGQHVVGVVNLDMPRLTFDFTDVVAFGAEHSTMGEAVGAAAAQMGIALSPDPMPEQGIFTRSDHYSFVKQGIPSVMLDTGEANGGGAATADFLKNHYHRVSDQLDLPFNWSAGARFAALNTAIARHVADAPQAPLWYADSFFGKVLAPDAPKAPQRARPAAP